MDNLSNNGKYRIFLKSTDDDSYFYSNTSYQWFVVSEKTGDSLFEFSGSESSSRSGDSNNGTEDVSFDETGYKLIVKSFEGETEIIPLPLEIDFAEEGKSIVLKYESGEIQTRERKQLVFFTKYGEPIYTPLKQPGE